MDRTHGNMKMQLQLNPTTREEKEAFESCGPPLKRPTDVKQFYKTLEINLLKSSRGDDKTAPQLLTMAREAVFNVPPQKVSLALKEVDKLSEEQKLLLARHFRGVESVLDLSGKMFRGELDYGRLINNLGFDQLHFLHCAIESDGFSHNDLNNFVETVRDVDQKIAGHWNFRPL